MAVILAVVCLGMSGCSSLVMKVDLNKAQVKEIDFNKIYGSKISGEIMSHGKKKYQIGGTDAFYILPNGLPEPESILDFQVVDLIDGTTTVYAYQALYHMDDSTGRGGKARQGKRLEQTAQEAEEETTEEESVISADNILKRDDADFEVPLSKKEELQEQIRKEEEEKKKEEEAKTKVWAAEDPGDDGSFNTDDVKQMVTVMMTYNTSTGDYKVLFSAVDKVKVEIKKSFGTASTVVYMEPKSPGILSMGMEGMTVRENNPIFTQIVDKNYFLYYGGRAYLFTSAGKIVYYNDLTQITTLSEKNWSSIMIGSLLEQDSYTALLPEAAMLDSVFMDNRQHLYIQYSYPRPKGNTAGKAKIDQSTGGKEEQSLDDMEDTTITSGSGSQNLTGTVTQMCVVSRADVGNAKSRNGEMANSNYFYSDNINYEKQVERIRSLLDGCALTFSEEPSDAEIDQWMNEQLVDFDKDIPTIYGPYSFNSPGMPLQLCFYGNWIEREKISEEEKKIQENNWNAIFGWGTGDRKEKETKIVEKGKEVWWNTETRTKAQLEHSLRYLTDLGFQDEEEAFEYLVKGGYLTPLTADNYEILKDYYESRSGGSSRNGFIAYMPSQSESTGSQLLFFTENDSSFRISEQEVESEEIEVTLHLRWEDEEETSERSVTKKIRIPKRYRLYITGSSTTSKVQTIYPGGRAYPSPDRGYLSVKTSEKQVSQFFGRLVLQYLVMPPYIVNELLQGVTCVNIKQFVDSYLSLDGYFSGDRFSVISDRRFSQSEIREVRNFPVMLNEIPRNAHVVTALRAGEAAKKEVIIQSDKSLMVFPSDEKAYLVNTSMLLFDIYGDVMNVDFEQPRQGDKEITGSYLSQGLKLYKDADGTWWLYAVNPDKGLLKINLDQCARFQEELAATGLTDYQHWVVQNTQKIGANTSYDGSGQISAYPYYCVWLGDEAKDCYAIGFQSLNYTYGAEDLCGAKLYHMSLVDETATVNLAYSSIRKNPVFQKAYGERDMDTCYKSWASNIELLNLMQDEATQTTLSNYFDFLMSAVTGKEKAYNAFTSILTKTTGGREVSFDEKELKEQLNSCRSRQSLESLLAQLRPELAQEEASETGRDPAESQLEDPLNRMAREQEEALKKLDQRIEAGEFTREESRESFDYSAPEIEEKDQVYLDSKSRIIAKLKDLNGYTEDTKWNELLEEIVDNLHPATTYSEYKLAKKKKEEELAKKKLEEQKRLEEEERIRALALKQQAELEKSVRELAERLQEEKDRRNMEGYSEVAESIAAAKRAAEESSKAESEAASRAVEELIRESEVESKAAEMSEKAAEASRALQEREASDELEEEDSSPRGKVSPEESSPQEGGSDYE